jgi:phospholipase/carboxylesterase
LPGAGFGGLQWFPLTFRDPGEYWRGVSQAGPIVDRCLDAELGRYRLPPTRLALVGFSQGTMLALHVGLRRGTAPAALIGYSGMLAGPEHLAADLRCRPPILLVHGAEDDVIPVEALHFSREALAQAGLALEWHERAGLGHGIDPAGLALGGDFLVENLNPRGTLP